MLTYTMKRLALMVPVVLGTTFLIYALVFALPGDPIATLKPENMELTPSTRAAMEARYNLDDPFLVQYAKYLGGALTGDFGTDFHGTPVTKLIAYAWPVTLLLALTAWVFKVVLGLFVGIYAGLREGRAGDHGSLLFTVVFMAVPSFVIALGAQYLFGIRLKWVDPVGSASGWPLSFLLPSLVIALEGAAGLGRLTRTSLVEVMRGEYIRTARAKGVAPRRILWGHAMRNALIPVSTYLGLSFAGLLGGAVVIEAVFGLPGIGGELVRAVQAQEGTVVVGISTLLVLAYLLVNLVIDLLYPVIDPRIRHD